MKYINFNEKNFIEWLSKEKKVFNISIDYLFDYLIEYKKVSLHNSKITKEEIKELVEKYSSFSDLSKTEKNNHIVQLRYVAYGLTRKYTKLTFKEIAPLYGKKYSSVITGVKRLKTRLNQKWFKDYKEIYDYCDIYLTERKLNIIKKDNV